MKILYKISKNTSNSKTKIVEKKIEDMFSRRKDLAMKKIKQFAKLKLHRRDMAGLLNSTILRILNRKNEVYTFFYMLKFKRQDIGNFEIRQLCKII